MGPECNATALAGHRSKAAKQLDHEPVSQHKDRWDGDGRCKESQKYEHVYLNSWIQQNVGSHHAANGAVSTNLGNLRIMGKVLRARGGALAK